MSDVFDRIAASSPQNATAARVTSRGEIYDPVVQYSNHWHSDAPPKMRPIPDRSFATCSDMLGRRQGRLTVIGLAAEYNPSKPARWVVRCDCGDYETRNARAIRNELNSEDRCQKCHHLRKVKWRYETLGPRSIDEIIGQK